MTLNSIEIMENWCHKNKDNKKQRKSIEREKKKLLENRFGLRKVPAYCWGPTKSDLHTWHN